MNDKEKDMILKKLKKLSKEDQISYFRDYFIEKVIDGYILENLNGFLALGVFKIPTDHIDKKMNTMWFFGVGVGKTENEIVVHTNTCLTIDEVEGFIRVLTEGLKVAKKLGVKRTKM